MCICGSDRRQTAPYLANYTARLWDFQKLRKADLFAQLNTTPYYVISIDEFVQTNLQSAFVLAIIISTQSPNVTEKVCK